MRGDCQAWRNEIEEGTTLGGGALTHLSACAGCRAVRDENEKLRRILSDLERVEPPSDFDFRLRARMARHDGPVRPFFSSWSYALGLFAAACVVAICSLALLRGTIPEPQTSADLQASGVVASDAPAARVSGERDGPFAPAGQTIAATVPSENSGGAKQVRRRKSSVRPTARQTSGPMSVSREPGESVYSSYSAPIRTATQGNEALNANQRRMLAIHVGGSEETLRVLLRDERGGARFVPTRSVSFGAQQIVARERAAQKVSYENQEGVW